MSEKKVGRRKVLYVGAGAAVGASVLARVLLGGRLSEDERSFEIPMLSASEMRMEVMAELQAYGVQASEQSLQRFEADYDANLNRLAGDPELSLGLHFLLSTDFFQSGEDTSRPVEYVRFYDPYVHPCYTPYRS